MDRGLQVAVEKGYTETFKEIIQAKRLQDKSHGYYLLCSALKNGHAEIAKILLENGAPADRCSDSGNGPLILALLHLSNSTEKSEIVQLILDRKVDVNRKGTSGPALIIACSKGDEESAKLLLQHGAEVKECAEQPLFLAAQSGSAAICEMLLKKGADVNSVQECEDDLRKEAAARLMPGIALKYKCTALHRASENGHVEVVKLLINYGADLNCKDNALNSPLILACYSGQVEVVKVLLENGSLLNSNNNLFLEPLAIVYFAGFDQNHPKRDEILQIFCSYFTKCMALKDSTSETLLRSFIQRNTIPPLVSLCERELTVMKSAKIAGSETTYFDVLSKSVRNVADLLCGDVLKVLSSGQYKTKFPYYGSSISTKFERSLLFRKAGEAFERCMLLPKRWAYVCTENILKYLRDYDLQALSKAREMGTETAGAM